MFSSSTTPLVTLDLFSALINSRVGGAACLDALARGRHWSVDGRALYDGWDRRNKISQRDTCEWISFAEHSRRSLSATYRQFGLDGDADTDVSTLLASLPHWPLWPDVPDALATLTERFAVGILSNVDDDLFRATRAAALVDERALFTSERLGAYKPSPVIYRRAVDKAAGQQLIHVAASARDVRGALEAGLQVIRVSRPGHVVDPDGPRPHIEVASLDQVAGRVEHLVNPDVC